MPMTPTGFVGLKQLDKVVAKAIRKLGKRVASIRYNVSEDWSGDPALYFRIVLFDADSREEILMDTIQPIEAILTESIRPREDWGLIPYFHYRSQSEQVEYPDPIWD